MSNNIDILVALKEDFDGKYLDQVTKQLTDHYLQVSVAADAAPTPETKKILKDLEAAIRLAKSELQDVWATFHLTKS
jgi:CHASE3 domain sensor protein